VSVARYSWEYRSLTYLRHAVTGKHVSLLPAVASGRIECQASVRPGHEEVARKLKRLEPAAQPNKDAEISICGQRVVTRACEPGGYLGHHDGLKTH